MFHNSEIQMKKQQTNEEIARVIEREQVISYKKKPTTKLNKDSEEDKDEIDSTPSLKSGVFSDDSVRFQKKNTPLPELNRQKKRIFSKNMIGQFKQVNNYLEKEVRQHDNLILKQKNNYLTTENMKLKTKIMNLEKQNSRLTKIIEDDQTKPKPKPTMIFKDSKYKGSESLSLKMTIKNLRKQLDDQKKENEKIKWSVKFTTINQLEVQREAIMEETNRLRKMLQEQQLKRAHLKVKQQGVSHMEQKLYSLNQKCLSLMKENNQLTTKLRKVEQFSKKNKQLSENQKNLSKMLFNARRVIKEKERQIEGFKMHSEKNLDKEDSASKPEIKSSKEVEKQQIFNTKKRSKDSQKRVMSKSAQKYRKPTQEISSSCQKCQKLMEQNELLVKKIEQLSLQLKEEKEKGSPKRLGDFRREEIQVPTVDEINHVAKFLQFRFKAHHLGLLEAEKYLINSENVEQAQNEEISVSQMSQYLVAEPFSVISNLYLEVLLIRLFYPQAKQGSKLRIEDSKTVKKGTILKNFRKLIPSIEIMEQSKQQEMFIQVAELVTNYHQHIITALNRKRNGEGTISQEDLSAFFNEIELQKEFIDFIITQIILQSLDLEHLNYYSMFEIFYMPPQPMEEQVQPPHKKKFEVDHSQIVKEQDQQYEQSRSYVEAKQKTQSQRDQQEFEDDNSGSKDKHKNLKIINEEEEEKCKENIHQEPYEYEEEFEEERIIPEQNGVPKEQMVQDEIKAYKMEEMDEEYEEDFQSPC